MGDLESKATGPVPVSAMVESIVGCKWSLAILDQLASAPARPSALQRALPGLSAKVMNQRLRKMMAFGLLGRRVHGEKPPLEVEYRLMPFGRRFLRVIVEVRRLQAYLDEDRS